MAFNLASYNNVSVLNTATQIIAANPPRKGFNIYNNGSATIYIGMDANVTTSNGIPILPQGSLYDAGQFVAYRGNVYAISGSSGQDVRYWEWIE